MLRHRTRTRAPIRYLEISISVIPLDLGPELLAVLGGRQDVHDEPAMIERPPDRAVEPADMLDLRAHPFADRPSHRGNQRHGMRRYVDDATGEVLQVAAHISAVPRSEERRVGTAGGSEGQ